MLYLAVALVALLVGGATVAYLTRTRTLTIDPTSLEDSWERLHEADKKLQDTMSPADYVDTGLDGLR